MLIDHNCSSLSELNNQAPLGISANSLSLYIILISNCSKKTRFIIMSGRRTPQRSSPIKKESPSKTVNQSAASGAVIGHILGEQVPPTDAYARGTPRRVESPTQQAETPSKRMLPAAAADNSDGNKSEQQDPVTPAHGLTAAQRFFARGSGDEENATDENTHDTNLQSNQFNVSPVRHAPAENAFGTPDRPKDGNHGTAGTSVLFRAERSDEPESTVEDEQAQTTIDGTIEKRTVSRSPEGRKI